MRLAFAVAAIVALWLEQTEQAVVLALLAIAFAPTKRGRLARDWDAAIERHSDDSTIFSGRRDDDD